MKKNYYHYNKWSTDEYLKNYFQVLNNNYHILAISDCIDGNYNDSFELIENIEILTETL